MTEIRIKRKRNRSKGIPKTTGYFKKVGKRCCNICKEEFIMYGPYDRFCGSCKSTDFYRLDHSFSLGTL
jgi:hypothetical protein